MQDAWGELVSFEALFGHPQLFFFSFSMSRSIVHSLPTAYMIQEESIKMYSGHFVSFQSWEVAGVLQVESATLRRQPWV